LISSAMRGRGRAEALAGIVVTVVALFF